ncbi:hypothetical protein EAE96_005726 [Botrytis aclada]|nr:hypothetical protein EAE96_005726 [Botrytis aclada]
MLPTETFEILSHQTSISAETTHIAVVDAVVSPPVALPLSTEHSGIAHGKQLDFGAHAVLVGLMIFILFCVIGLILTTCVFCDMLQKDMKELIEYPSDNVHHSKKKKRSLLSIFRGASRAIERDNDVNDYKRDVRGFSKNIKIDEDGKISQDTTDELFLNVYPKQKN